LKLSEKVLRFRSICIRPFVPFSGRRFYLS